MGKGNMPLDTGKKDVLRQIDKTPAPKPEEFVFAVPAIPVDPKVLARPIIERAAKLIKATAPATNDKGKAKAGGQTTSFKEDLENLVVPPHLVSAQGKIRMPNKLLANYKRGTFALFKADDMQKFYDKQMKRALQLSEEGTILGGKAQKEANFRKQVEMFKKAGAKKMEAADVLYRCMDANSYMKKYRGLAKECFHRASFAANSTNGEIDTILKLQYLMTKWVEQK